MPSLLNLSFFLVVKASWKSNNPISLAQYRIIASVPFEKSGKPRRRPRHQLNSKDLLIENVPKQRVSPCDFVSLEHARNFFERRVKKYRAEKREAWTLFQCSCWEEVLYMIEKEELQNRQDDKVLHPNKG